MLRTSALVLVALTLSAATVPAVDALTSYSATIPINKWLLLVGDETSQVTVRMFDSGARGVMMLAPYHPDGTLSDHMRTSYASDGAAASAETGPSGPLAASAPGIPAGRTRSITSTPADSPGVRYFFVAGWGEKPFWRVEAQNVMPLGAPQPARYVRGVDLDGGAYVSAEVLGTSLPGGGNLHPQHSVHASTGRSLAFEIEHNLIGFVGVAPGHFVFPNFGEQTLIGPHGTVRCGCWAADFQGAFSYGPGTYTLTDNVTGVQQYSTPYGIWADVPFPFPEP